jgi:uncharacterized membrane protein YczE
MTAERKREKRNTEERLPHRTAGQLAGISLRILRAQIVVTFGLTLVYLANLGVAPWDMLAIGISYHTPLQYGTALNVVGICVILADVFLREKIGLSTIQDVLLSGWIIDLWTFLFRRIGVADVLLGSSGNANAAGQSESAAQTAGAAQDTGGFAAWFTDLPDAGAIALRIGLFVAGILIFCLGQLMVQSMAMGAGPRDTLVLGLGRKVPKVPIGAVTWGMLALVFAIGLLLGGPVGLGTIGAVFGMSLGQQLMCRIFHFEPRAVRHENAIETLHSVRGTGDERTAM